MRYCPECGNEVEDNPEFCSQCGEKISKESTIRKKTSTEKPVKEIQALNTENKPYSPAIKKAETTWNTDNNKQEKRKIKGRYILLGIIGFILICILFITVSGIFNEKPYEKNKEWINAGGAEIRPYDGTDVYEILAEEGHWKLEWDCIQGNGFHATIYGNEACTLVVHNINSEDSQGTLLFDVYYPGKPGLFYLKDTSNQTNGIWDVHVWYQYF
jgi:hypothetical protein